MTAQNPSQGKGWKMIRVPEEVYSVIMTRARSRNMAAWAYIYDAVSFYEKQAVRGNMPEVTRAAWYIYKLAATIAALRVKRSEDRLNDVMTVLSQIKTRLGIDVSDVERAVKAYYEKRNKTTVVALQSAMREASARILYAVLSQQSQ